jgi:hypothetical protein
VCSEGECLGGGCTGEEGKQSIMGWGKRRPRQGEARWPKEIKIDRRGP